MRWAVFLVLLGCAAGCRELSKRTNPHVVVLLTVADFRTDDIGAMGATPSLTPTLDQLIRTSVSFEQATSASAWPLPNLYALMASQDVEIQHPGGASNVKPLEGPTLAEVLTESGFETAAFGGGLNMPQWSGLTRGFNTVVQHPSGTLADLATLAFEWLREHVGQRRFLWLQVMDLAAAARSHDRQGYQEALRGLDASLRVFLESLDRKDLSREGMVLLIAGERGAALSQREVNRGLRPYDFLIRVPLLVHAPGLVPRRVTDPVGLIDVAPTIVDLAGIEMPASFQGASLQSVGLDGNRRTESFSNSAPAPWTPAVYALRTARWKLMYGEEGFELYDLRSDPKEQRDRAQQDAQTAFKLSQKLLQYRHRTRTSSGERTQELTLNAEVLKRLYDAGYW